MFQDVNERGNKSTLTFPIKSKQLFSTALSKTRAQCRSTKNGLYVEIARNGASNVNNTKPANIINNAENNYNCLRLEMQMLWRKKILYNRKY